jgi:hypothetical protein
MGSKNANLRNTKRTTIGQSKAQNMTNMSMENP